MAIIATGSKTVIDLSDGKSLSVYLGANQPRTQIHDVNGDTYSPNWTTTAGKLVITPVVYANQTAIALNNNALTITWKRKEGSGSPLASDIPKKRIPSPLLWRDSAYVSPTNDYEIAC